MPTMGRSGGWEAVGGQQQDPGLFGARCGVGWARTRRSSSARSASVITSGGMVAMGRRLLMLRPEDPNICQQPTRSCTIQSGGLGGLVEFLDAGGQLEVALG